MGGFRFEVTGKAEGMDISRSGAWVDIETTIRADTRGDSIVIATLVPRSEEQPWLDLWKMRVRVTVEEIE